MDKHLHIISLDVPLPADYGGAIDIFYKIVSLHQQGIKIHLHCFSGGRLPSDHLDEYCETVNYYQRKKFPRCFSLTLPYIVSSRKSKELLHNLQQDDYPVFMEGVHCTHLLFSNSLKNRRVFVRLHNAEFIYYNKLAGNENNIFKKLYYKTESFLLKRYERRIAGKARFWPMNINDTAIYKNLFAAKRIEFLPAFVAWDKVNEQHNKGCFCLYHGNLTVNENEKAARWLLTEVFNDISIPLVIAGKGPSEELEKLAHVHTNTCLVANPSDKELQDLIKKAQVNVLPSFNNTGVKLKILNALYNGRYCLVNKAAANGSAIDGLCHIAESAADFKQEAIRLYEASFDEDESAKRCSILYASYNNEKNARQLIEWIY